MVHKEKTRTVYLGGPPESLIIAKRNSSCVTMVTVQGDTLNITNGVSSNQTLSKVVR